MKKSGLTLSVLAAALAMGPQAHAVTITGGIGLLTTAGGTQLETWLGEGSLALTSIFSHQVGDGKTILDFHTAADGQGRTFAIMEVLSVNGVAANEIIGGYNPQSWYLPSSGYASNNETPNYADRTAAIFNLTDLVWRPQDTVPNDAYDGGLYQTYNGQNNGPSFGGGGGDLSVNGTLSIGNVAPFSYGVYPEGVNILGSTGHKNVQYGRMEVFTIAAASASSVPDGGNTLAMMLGGGLVCLVAAGRRKPSPLNESKEEASLS